MQKPRLVASDVDGTLLDPFERVTARTARAVHRVVSSGTPFVLVTGRPPRWVPAVADAAGVTGIAVCANGAVLYDIGADRVVDAALLDPLTLHDLARTLTTALPDSAFAVERIVDHAADDGFQSEPRYRDLSRTGHGHFLAEPSYEHPWTGGDSTEVPRAELLGHPAVKMLVRNPGMSSEQMADAARTLVGDTADVTFSTNNGLIEFSAPGVTKATGLAKVADRYGIPAAQVIAFGDMPNDIPMLRWAGHGVAMANAHPLVQAAADETTAPNSEDGVATILDRWF